MTIITRIEHEDGSARSELVWCKGGKLLGSIWTEDGSRWYARQTFGEGYWERDRSSHIDRVRALADLVYRAEA